MGHYQYHKVFFRNSMCATFFNHMYPIQIMHWNRKSISSQRKWFTQLNCLPIEDNLYNSLIILWFHASQFLQMHAPDSVCTLESKMLIQSENMMHSTTLLTNTEWLMQDPHDFKIPCWLISSNTCLRYSLCIGIENRYRVRESDPLNYAACQLNMINTILISYYDCMHANFFEFI